MKPWKKKNYNNNQIKQFIINKAMKSKHLLQKVREIAPKGYKCEIVDGN